MTSLQIPFLVVWVLLEIITCKNGLFPSGTTIVLARHSSRQHKMASPFEAYWVGVTEIYQRSAKLESFVSWSFCLLRNGFVFFYVLTLAIARNNYHLQ